jgi:hypothetical protein
MKGGENMQSLQQWALSLSAAMVTAGICHILTPHGSMEKIFRATVSVFFLCCLVSPFVLDSAALELQAREYPEAAIEERARRLEGAVDAQTEEAARWEIAKLVGEKLDELGINYRGVAITMEQNGQSGVRPSAEITLESVHEKDHREIKAALERELGFEVRLRYA